MATDCKQVATESREAHTSATDVHGTHKLPGISLWVVPGEWERESFRLS